MTESEIQVVIVEDHLALRKGVELLLRGDGIRVTGVADTPEEGARMIRERKPDLAIVDIGLDGGSGLDLVRQVLALDPTAGILLYTGAVEQSVLRAALDSGARGFAMKAGPAAELLAAVRVVAAGGEYVDPRIARLLEVSAAVHVPIVTPREREILDLLAEGLKSDEIAERLVLSPMTVDTHVRNLMRKLGARTRAHALALALKLREIEIGDAP